MLLTKETLIKEGFENEGNTFSKVINHNLVEITFKNNNFFLSINNGSYTIGDYIVTVEKLRLIVKVLFNGDFVKVWM